MTVFAKIGRNEKKKKSFFVPFLIIKLKTLVNLKAFFQTKRPFREEILKDTTELQGQLHW